MEKREREIIGRVCGVLNVVANEMESFQGDLFLDTPAVIEELVSGNKACLLIRRTGCDSVKRYEIILKEEKGKVSIFDCIEEAKKTLGVDFIVLFGREADAVDIIPVKEGLDGKIDSMVSRINDYSGKGIKASRKSMERMKEDIIDEIADGLASDDTIDARKWLEENFEDFVKTGLDLGEILEEFTAEKEHRHDDLERTMERCRE